PAASHRRHAHDVDPDRGAERGHRAAPDAPRAEVARGDADRAGRHHLRRVVVPPDSMTPSWRPSPERAASSNLAAFARLARERFGVTDGYAALHAWSCAQPEQFWPLLWDVLGIVGDRGERVLERGTSLADARF